MKNNKNNSFHKSMIFFVFKIGFEMKTHFSILIHFLKLMGNTFFLSFISENIKNFLLFLVEKCLKYFMGIILIGFSSS